MKRTLFAALLVAPCLALPAMAEGMKPAKPAAPARVTWEQHFAKANTTHDGHLTLEQAKAGYPSLVKHFTDIDVGGKGFITEDDMRAWHALQRAQHPPAGDNKLRPRHAFQPKPMGHPPVKASTIGTVPKGTHTVGPDAPASREEGRAPG